VRVDSHRGSTHHGRWLSARSCHSCQSALQTSTDTCPTPFSPGPQDATALCLLVVCKKPTQKPHHRHLPYYQWCRGLTSHSTHYRSFRGRFLQVIWPNQQCQSTEGNQLVLQIKLESHQDHSTMLQSWTEPSIRRVSSSRVWLVVGKKPNPWATHPVADLALEVAGGWWTRFAQIPFGLQLHVTVIQL